MPSPAETIQLGLRAGEDARADLLRRNVDPGKCEPLVHALRRAVAGVVASVELGLDVGPRQRYLNEVRSMLEREPEAKRGLPQPPKLFPSARLLRELDAACREARRGA
jgi:hypothetical protein